MRHACLAFGLLSTTILAAQDDPALVRSLREISAIREADAIVVARVATVHPSPGVWCGILRTVQVVTYQIERVVAGKPVAGTIEVEHLLVANSPLVAANAPFLRPDLIAPGVRAILCLQSTGDGWAVGDETCGVRLIDPPKTADPAQGAVLSAVLGDAALRAWIHAERSPLPIVLGGATPLPLTVTPTGFTVEFVPPELVHESNHFTISRLSVDRDRAEVQLAMPREGVFGTFVCRRLDGVWRVEERKIAER